MSSSTERIAESAGTIRGSINVVEQELLDKGWQIEDCDRDRHGLRKGGSPTYRIYFPPDYRQPNGGPIAWALDDALAAEEKRDGGEVSGVS
jgi:hypothetical protein